MWSDKLKITIALSILVSFLAVVGSMTYYNAKENYRKMLFDNNLAKVTLVCTDNGGVWTDADGYGYGACAYSD